MAISFSRFEEFYAVFYQIHYIQYIEILCVLFICSFFLPLLLYERSNPSAWSSIPDIVSTSDPFSCEAFYQALKMLVLWVCVWCACIGPFVPVHGHTCKCMVRLEADIGYLAHFLIFSLL